MNYRNVGKSGLKVSEIAVGSWMTDLVGSKKVDIARDTIKLAYENGINFFDCADKQPFQFHSCHYFEIQTSHK